MMLERKFTNKDLEIELTSFIDSKQNIWFLGKEVAKILGYNNTNQAIKKHVDKEDKSGDFINETGFYSLLISSKLKTAKKVNRWVTSKVLPSIRKFGYYKLFDNPNNQMFKIENEMDLHCKVVHLIRNYYPKSIMVPGLGENQNTSSKRINSWKKGYTKGQPDLMILNYHKDYKGLCIEFKSPTNNYKISEAQLNMKKNFIKNKYAFIISNDYDKISKLIHKYMDGVCKYCIRQ